MDCSFSSKNAASSLQYALDISLFGNIAENCRSRVVLSDFSESSVKRCLHKKKVMVEIENDLSSSVYFFRFLWKSKTGSAKSRFQYMFLTVISLAWRKPFKYPKVGFGM